MKDTSEELPEELLEKVIASPAHEGSTSSTPLLAPNLHTRLDRLARRVWQADKVTGAVSKALMQRDRVISDRDTAIAWLNSKLEALGAEHWEDAATLDSVLASMEARMRV
ncbi:hypothetical protein Nepgr_001245 [Nepenthes gracilis]|uniref:Uncharacterized protein n=1 Tax=Nepenthes gracilis TaxID=150966 RepID=A0AAD3RXA1_NEPGR|nr:hypothetical protein Nepgr_001245 [Nepenthes gracilis]